MKTSVVKRSIVIAGHKTSVSLEDEFWEGLREIADKRDQTLSHLVATIDAKRQHTNLSSAIRLLVPSGKWLEFGGAISGNMKVSFQAARSIG